MAEGKLDNSWGGIFRYVLLVLRLKLTLFWLGRKIEWAKFRKAARAKINDARRTAATRKPA
jgi:hypothetical protein